MRLSGVVQEPYDRERHLENLLHPGLGASQLLLFVLQHGELVDRGGLLLSAAAESLPVGCSGQFSSVTRLIPRRGRVVDILFLNSPVAVHNDALLLRPFVAVRSRFV